MKTKKAPVVIYDQYSEPFSIIGNKLIEGTVNNYDGQLSKFINLTTLGNILRSNPLKGQKSSRKTKSKSRIYYGYVQKVDGKNLFSKMRDGVNVFVNQNGATQLSIGCVRFDYNNAKLLRRAALKSSKVTA